MTGSTHTHTLTLSTQQELGADHVHRDGGAANHIHVTRAVVLCVGGWVVEFSSLYVC